MSIVLREYQSYAIQTVWEYFGKKSGNPVVVMPTGTGKSVVIAELARSMLLAYPLTKILVVTHVKELIQQNYDKFLSVWPNAPAGINSSSVGRSDTKNNVIFAGVQTVYKKASQFGKVDIVMVDEAHMINPKEGTMYKVLLDALLVTNPNMKVIGFTATDFRMGMGSIVGDDALFSDVCCNMSGVEPFNWLLDQYYLLPVVSTKPNFILDLQGVTKRAGEYDAKKLEAAVNKNEITRKALKHAIEVAGDRKSWLIFASGVQHAKDISDMLNDELGIPAEAVYTGAEDRDGIIKRFKEGKIRALVNNNILTTGFDHPGIDLIICLRPTMSVVLWIQMLGRGTRPCFMPGYDLTTLEGRRDSVYASHKQNCLVLDYAANGKRLGPINDPVIPGRPGHKTGVAPVKECPACGVENHASARFCGGKSSPVREGYCGAEFVFAVKIKDEASTAPLIATTIQQELPVIEEMRVDSVQYSRMSRSGRHSMVQVSYNCGLNLIKELVCFDHPLGNYARTKAESWWRRRTNSPVPVGVDQALKWIEEYGVAAPTHIRVQTNKAYPDILAVDFTGTNFGKNAVVHEENDAIDINAGTIGALTDIPF